MPLDWQSGIGSRIRDQGPGVRDQGLGIGDWGSEIQAPGSVTGSRPPLRRFGDGFWFTGVARGGVAGDLCHLTGDVGCFAGQSPCFSFATDDEKCRAQYRCHESKPHHEPLPLFG